MSKTKDRPRHVGFGRSRKSARDPPSRRASRAARAVRRRADRDIERTTRDGIGIEIGLASSAGKVGRTATVTVETTRVLLAFAMRTRLGTSAALAPRMAKDMVKGGGGGVKVDARGVRRGSCEDLSVEGAARIEHRRARNLQITGHGFWRSDSDAFAGSIPMPRATVLDLPQMGVGRLLPRSRRDFRKGRARCRAAGCATCRVSTGMRSGRDTLRSPRRTSRAT